MNSIFSGPKYTKKNSKISNVIVIYSLFYIDPSLQKPESMSYKLSCIYRIPEFEISQLLNKLKELYVGEEVDLEREAVLCFMLSKVYNLTLGEAALYIFTHKSRKHGKT